MNMRARVYMHAIMERCSGAGELSMQHPND